MCGIFGFQKASGATFEDFLSLLKHRGPDSRGIIDCGPWTIGHVRLTILDRTDFSHQPFIVNKDVLTYNGEIYNYRELKEKYSHIFSSTHDSDTEVLATLLSSYGMSILPELNGMFAFGFLSESGELFLVRDRFGVKPLYFVSAKRGIAFASEIKPLLTFAGESHWTGDVSNPDIQNNSGYRDIFAVAPGTYLQISKSGQIKEHGWYQPSSVSLPRGRGIKAWAKKLDSILIDSVELRLRADVPVAISLSGGVDSSLLYAICKQDFGSDVVPFVFSKGANDLDARGAIRRSRLFGDEPVIVNRVEHSIQTLRSVFMHLENPMWDHSALAYWSTYEAISTRGFKVVLEGHGADELFGGYPYMLKNIMKEFLQKNNLAKALGAYLAYYFAQSNLTVNVDRNLLTDALRLYRGRSGAQVYPTQELLIKAFSEDILPEVLRVFDRLSMAHGIESRMPFMDYRLVEFARTVPPEFLANSRGSKAILREILSKRGLKFEARTKSKTGFSSDILRDAASDSFVEFATTYSPPSAKTGILAEFASPRNSQSLPDSDDWERSKLLWKNAAGGFYHRLAANPRQMIGDFAEQA